MFNERTQRPELSRSGVVRTQGCVRDFSRQDERDIPVSELNETRSRRRCDGTLVGEPEGATQNGCSQGRCGGWGLVGHPLAMVYSPCQAWRGAYTPDVALSRGTLFSELDLPFEPTNRKRGCIL